MNVVICGETEAELADTVIRALAANGGVQYSRGSGLMRDPSGVKPLHNLYCMGDALRVGLDRAVVIFNTDMPPGGELYLPERCRCIVREEDEALISLLKRRTSCPLFLCGMSSACAFSASSIDELNPVVSIQSRIETESGYVTEPMDIPLRLTKPAGLFAMLSACAAVALSGPEESRVWSF